LAKSISQARLQVYRAKTYWLERRLSTVDQAVEFVRERGFAFFWPIKGVEFPSLWAAVAGDRPVASEHDDPGHVTWGWKDSLLGKREWYYAKLLRKRATLISLDVAPYFYALTENYGDPEEDYLIQYEAGRLKQETKLIYEALLKSGPMDTVALRRKSGLSSQSSKYRFERGLAELQADMKILPVGVAEAGAWNYAFIYDLVPRHLPEIPEQARRLSQRKARRTLLEFYYRSVGIATRSEARKVLGWGKRELERALEDCEADGVLRRNTEGSPRELVVIDDLL
jgi:hypothetical protein